MDTSPKTDAAESLTTDGEWKIVPRRGRYKRSLPKIRKLQEQEPWMPTDTEIDTHRESKLMERIQTCLKRLENSQFYQVLMDQIESPEIMDSINRTLGSQMTFEMVIYGVGSIESYEPPRLQLCLAILLKRKFHWIGDIQVFDPILSATESRVLESLGCSVLSVNEQGRRRALQPTLFFMPHCEAELYDNLLRENWDSELLSRIVLFGNSFEAYEQHIAVVTNSLVSSSARHILAIRKFTNEHKIKVVSNDYFAAFHDSSWHFFNLQPEMKLEQLYA